MRKIKTSLIDFPFDWIQIFSLLLYLPFLSGLSWMLFCSCKYVYIKKRKRAKLQDIVDFLISLVFTTSLRYHTICMNMNEALLGSVSMVKKTRRISEFIFEKKSFLFHFDENKEFKEFIFFRRECFEMMRIETEEKRCKRRID